jgi:peroxiredoxin
VRHPRIALLAAAAGLVLPAVAGCSGGSKLGTHGEIAPDGERAGAAPLGGSTLTGSPLSLAALRGQVVVLNAFGSWCGPCQQETPALQQTYSVSRAKGVTFVGLAERDDLGKLKQFLVDKQVTYPVIDDDEGRLVAGLKNPVFDALPATVLLDRKGRVAAQFAGQVLASQLQAAVDTLAAEPA